LQLADAVHRIDPAKSVILLTGFAFGPEQQPTSINCVLKKPLVREELREALRSVMGGRRRPELARLPQEIAQGDEQR
jgi:hypothetical protein